MGRVTASNQQTSGQTYSFSYAYDLAGDLTSETYPSGRVVTNSYDVASRVTGIAGSLSGVKRTYLTQAQYAPQGSPSSYLYGNTLSRTNGYNNRLQPTQMQDATSSNNVLMSTTLGWGSTNNNGNLQTATSTYGQPYVQNFATFQESFTYDGVNRLSGVTDSGGRAVSAMTSTATCG